MQNLIPFKIYSIRLVISLFIILFIFSRPTHAESEEDSTVQFKRLNINNVSTSFSNNGLSDYNLFGTKGFWYPKNSHLTVFNWSGFLWGGKINNQIRVSGTVFKSSLQPAGDKKIYRVRPDYKSGDLTAELSEGEGTEIEIREAYEQDWNNWPGNEGAPFEDINKNGTYEPDIDIPGIPHANQTIWFKANDFNSSLVDSIFGSQPLGIELQSAYWAYNTEGPLNNMIFRKYKIINKGSDNIEQMYCAISTDPDVGNATDDFAGCDTLLNLAFAYNAFDTDNIFNQMPPALGFSLLKGPIVNNAELNLSSFNFILNAHPLYGYPTIGNKSYEEGAVRFYNLFQGILNNGEQYHVPEGLGGGETSFPFSGNPIAGEGWLDGSESEFQPGNRDMNLSTGPFNLMPGEEQEIVFVQIAAGGYNNITRFEAIDSLKSYTQYANDYYKKITGVETGKKNEIPQNFELYQNYPNPFNPSTTISYNLPRTSDVELKIYDILGHEVKSFSIISQNAGTQNIVWNGTNNYNEQVSSGIYIYKLKAVSRESLPAGRQGKNEVFKKAAKLVLMK